MKNLNTKVAKILTRIRQEKPLIHHITNYVVMNDTANVTLHIGALPVMAHAPEEMEEMTGIAGALVLNIGTLSKLWIRSMFIAAQKANKMGIPVVLDGVGAGATSYRTNVCKKLLAEVKIAVLKGNAGEIGVLSGAGGEVRGVESVGKVDNLAPIVKDFAKRSKVTVIATGKRDIISDGNKTYAVDNGDFWLTTITGTGCMSTAVVGAFCAVEKDYAFASACALACFGLAAEFAAKKALGPASFKVALLDGVYNLDEKSVIQGVKIDEIR